MTFITRTTDPDPSWFKNFAALRSDRAVKAIDPKEASSLLKGNMEMQIAEKEAIHVYNETFRKLNDAVKAADKDFGPATDRANSARHTLTTAKMVLQEHHIQDHPEMHRGKIPGAVRIITNRHEIGDDLSIFGFSAGGAV